ncbi:MAG: gluconate 2-dehydrogenase subunit 3 family protein [Candidatus Binatia bacterium]
MSDNRNFSADEQRVLASVLDEIIPPSSDGRLLGAGQLGLARYIDEALQQTPEIRSMIAQGLSDLDNLARSRNAPGFAALSKPDKLQLLNGQAFVLPLTFHTYVGYYQHARVVEALGLEARPPHPKGYQMEPNDLSLLDVVRRRPKLYREY